MSSGIYGSRPTAYGTANVDYQKHADPAAQMPGQGYAGENVQQTIVRQRIAELADVLHLIGKQVHAIHGRVVPPVPQPTGDPGRSAPQSYDQMLDTLVSAANELRSRLDEIGERV